MSVLCAKTRMKVELCGCDPCETTIQPPAEAPKFAVVRMSDVPERATVWVIDGLLPESDVVVLVGEEGIGKGLWWVEQARQITADGGHVVMIVAEDDPHRTLKPRMRAAGVDTDRVHIIVKDVETMTGHPYLPTDSDEVEGVLRDTGARLLIIDPWVSVVPGHLMLKDTQQARAALDPLTVLARRTGCCILAVAHTNRTNGSTRDRVGLTAVLRQAARVLILALEDPDDDTQLVVGVDKANNTGRAAAARWVKTGQGDDWRVRLLEADSGATIRQWDDTYRVAQDGRTTDKWSAIVERAKDTGGMLTRTQIREVYGDGHTDAADRAISRWLATGRLVRHERGVFEVPAAQVGHIGRETHTGDVPSVSYSTEWDTNRTPPLSQTTSHTSHNGDGGPLNLDDELADYMTAQHRKEHTA